LNNNVQPDASRHQREKLLLNAPSRTGADAHHAQTTIGVVQNKSEVQAMRWILALLATMMATGFFAGLATSQQPITPSTRDLAGTYEMKEMDGSPIRPGSTWRLHYVPVIGSPSPMFVGFVTRDSGNGPQIVRDRNASFVAVPSGSGYAWVTASGTFAGTLTQTSYGYHMEYTHGDGDEMRLERE
jgi:hypothetical protein